MNNFKMLLPFGIVIVLFSTLLCISSFKSEPNEDSSPLDTLTFEFKSSNIFSDSLLIDYLRDIKIKEPIIVYNQSRLETGNFNSLYFRQDNNLWGFRNSKGYMRFKHWKHCCKFMQKWQKKYYKGGNYYDFLIRIGYAEDPLYVQKLKKMNNGLESK